MFSFFRSKPAPLTFWPVDMHSHLVPEVDDGSKSPQDTMDMLRRMRDLGMRKWITTPHIFHEYYRNTPETIRAGMNRLNTWLKENHEEFEVEAAAEYYLDDHLMTNLKAGNELLTFGKQYLLVETNMISDSQVLNEFAFEAALRGYQPVLAHPERYDYLTGNFTRLEDLRDRGVLMQVNLLSLLGHYGPASRKMAREMIDRKFFDFAGTDCHNPAHAMMLQELSRDPWVHKLAAQEILNYRL